MTTTEHAANTARAFLAAEIAMASVNCGASSHHWSRELQALPTYVKPYVKRHKTHAADAEAICEAVTRETLEVADFG